MSRTNRDLRRIEREQAFNLVVDLAWAALTAALLYLGMHVAILAATYGLL